MSKISTTRQNQRFLLDEIKDFPWTKSNQGFPRDKINDFRAKSKDFSKIFGEKITQKIQTFPGQKS